MKFWILKGEIPQEVSYKGVLILDIFFYFLGKFRSNLIK